jgi:hypothetical protein
MDQDKKRLSSEVEVIEIESKRRKLEESEEQEKCESSSFGMTQESQDLAHLDDMPHIEDQNNDQTINNTENHVEQVVHQSQDDHEDDISTYFQDEKVEQAKVMLKTCNQRVVDIQNNFMNEMTNIVNKFLTDLSERTAAKGNMIDELMNEVDTMYSQNVDTATQLQSAKDLTQKLYADIGSC